MPQTERCRKFHRDMTFTLRKIQFMSDRNLDETMGMVNELVTEYRLDEKTRRSALSRIRKAVQFERTDPNYAWSQKKSAMLDIIIDGFTRHDAVCSRQSQSVARRRGGTRGIVV